MLVKSLFSFSITRCIHSEPWWVCKIQRLNYPGSNQISLFCKKFWDEPWSDVNILVHPMKHRPEQGSITLLWEQGSTMSTWALHLILLMLKQCLRGEKDGSCWVLYVRMGNYFEVLEMSESVREIHDANSQSCNSQLVKKPNALV